MKNYLILHFGFVMPTPEDMEKWNAWFASIADRKVSMAHLPFGREITHSRIKDLPMAEDSITGYTVIQAKDLDEATEIAKACPIVASTRVYEISKQSD